MLLAEGAQINDKLHRLTTENTAFIPNGVYRFKTQEDANKHQLDCLAKGITKVALERSNGAPRSELIAALAQWFSQLMQRDAEQAVAEIITTITATLAAGNSVEIRGLVHLP